MLRTRTTPHPGWSDWLSELHRAGLAVELDLASLLSCLGRRALLPPTAEDGLVLLDAYFRGEVAEGRELSGRAALRRVRNERYFVHREGEPATAGKLLVRFQVIARELGPLELVKYVSSCGTLRSVAIRTLDDTLVKLDTLREEPLGDGTALHTVTVEAIVEGINTLLERFGHLARFVPLIQVGGIDAYLALTPAQIKVIDKLDLLDQSGTENDQDDQSQAA